MPLGIYTFVDTQIDKRSVKILGYDHQQKQKKECAQPLPRHR